MNRQKLDEATIFNTARRVEAGPARRLYLERACGGDLPLLARLEALLRIHDEDHGFLQPPTTGLPNSHEERVQERPGSRVGPYKLLELIGEGGFGVVFMAEQMQPVRRKVALKVLKPGMDTKQVIARFEAERQALALMDHPNIAQILDGGTTESGRPYFVMELVRGVPITEFCDRNHLAVQQRLQLFAAVCHAVQHAHHKGVIHRDLKPSNIMVTSHDGVPVVKVIDFGIAKAMAQDLTEKTLFTAYGQMIGTPAYMSPEQAEMSGLDIDTRSDVFSLGVLLYELLTGTTPLDSTRLGSAGFAELQRLIREEEPPRPSTRLSTLGEKATVAADNRGTQPRQLARLLAGDLDWIVLKALEKDRNRRYPSPGSFAEDVEHYLRHEPVVARPASAAYRVARFTQRHRGAVLAAAAVAVALLVGAAVAAWQAVAATRAKHEALAAAEAEAEAKGAAQAHEAQTRAALDFVRNHILAAARPKGQEGGLGHDVTLRSALEAALPAVGKSFADQPLVEAQLRLTLGDSFQYLGEPGIAADQYDRARALFATHFGPDHAETLQCMDQLATAYDALGQYRGALKLREKAMALRRAKLGPDHPDTLLSMIAVSASHQALGQHPEALKLREAAVPLLQARLGPDNPQTLGAVNNLASSYYFFGRYTEAVKLFEDVVARRKAALGPDHPDTLLSMNNLAATYAALGRGADARTLYEETLTLRRARLGPDHPHTLLSMNNLANCYADLLGMQAEAYALRKQVLEQRRAKLGPTHPETLIAMNNLANSLSKLGRHAEALQLRQEALAHEKAQLGIDHPETLWSMKDVASSLVKLHRGAEAVPILDECVRLARSKVVDPDLLPGVMNLRLQYFKEVKDIAGCRATAELWEGLHLSDADSLYKAARYRAVTAAVLRTSGTNPDTAGQADAEADRAMAWLRKALAGGYKDVTNMKKDKDLDALRGRGDFCDLLSDLEAGQGREKK